MEEDMNKFLDECKEYSLNFLTAVKTMREKSNQKGVTTKASQK
jgi:hypothetical protein